MFKRLSVVTFPFLIVATFLEFVLNIFADDAFSYKTLCSQLRLMCIRTANSIIAPTTTSKQVSK